MPNIHSRRGVTLIELILAIAIFSIIVLAFMSLFSSSLLWIFDAGDKGRAYSLAQQDVESRIAAGEGVYVSDLVINFDGVDYSIRGGLVESDQIIRRRTSQLEVFVPLIPTIVINPAVRSEGSLLTSVVITGYETDFNASTVVELYDRTGNNKIGSTIIPIVQNNISASFSLPGNLLNSDYVIRVKTPISGEPDQIVRAKYTVEQPYFLAVGKQSVYISENTHDWVLRSSMSGFPSITSTINAVVNGGTKYLAVGDNGLILVSQEKYPWLRYTVGSENFLSATWSAPYSKYYIVGTGGVIYSSYNGSSWSPLVSSTTSDLMDITAVTLLNGKDILVAVGSDGNVIYSENGKDWSVSANLAFSISGVAAGYNGLDDIIVAIGDGGLVSTSTNGINWTAASSIPQALGNNLNAISYNQALGVFIAVGDNGQIITSSNGSTWTNVSFGSEHYFGVFARSDQFIVVGENGTILSSSNGSSWTGRFSNPDDHLYSVTGK